MNQEILHHLPRIEPFERKVYPTYRVTKQKEKIYSESLKEYQEKIYSPGHYTGGRIHPALKTKTKAGGWGMILAGIILLIFGITQLLNFSLINMGGIFHLFLSTLLIIVGIKFLRQNFHH